MPQVVDVNRCEPRLEAAASGALGMDVRVGGRPGMGRFPGSHATVEDGHILGGQGAGRLRADVSGPSAISSTGGSRT